jgi:quaternary ammonium compound-resistance protein SugE
MNPPASARWRWIFLNDRTPARTPEPLLEHIAGTMCFVEARRGEGRIEMLGWLALVFAGLMEIIYAGALEKSNTFTRLWPSVVFLVGVTLSMAGLAYAIRTIPLGTAYAVWVGIGAAGTTLYGMVALNESTDTLRLLCVLLIITGVVGLNLLHTAST